jgi:5,10-methenyltetrahydromethanopterin hydrogenase
MTNIFEETYNTIAEAKKAYKAATTAEERDAARDTAKAAEDRIDELGDIAWKIWRAYEKSRDNENEILDFDDIIWDRDVEALTACMKENGIKRIRRCQNPAALLSDHDCRNGYEQHLLRGPPEGTRYYRRKKD